jgi:hypothetical protein
MNLSPSCGDKRLTKPLIGTVINIPAASAETVAVSVTVVGSAFLSNLLAPATDARMGADAGLSCWRHQESDARSPYRETRSGAIRRGTGSSPKCARAMPYAW